MNAGWIDVVALVDATDAPLFLGLLERHVSGRDATYFRLDDHLFVLPDTEDDEAALCLGLPDWDTIGGVRRIGEHGHLLPVHLADDVQRWLDHGLFEGAAAVLTTVRLELRDGGALRRLEEVLDRERPSFTGQHPVFCPV